MRELYHPNTANNARFRCFLWTWTSFCTNSRISADVITPVWWHRNGKYFVPVVHCIQMIHPNKYLQNYCAAKMDQYYVYWRSVIHCKNYAYGSCLIGFFCGARTLCHGCFSIVIQIRCKFHFFSPKLLEYSTWHDNCSDIVACNGVTWKPHFHWIWITIESNQARSNSPIPMGLYSLSRWTS